MLASHNPQLPSKTEPTIRVMLKESGRRRWKNTATAAEFSDVTCFTWIDRHGELLTLR